MEDRRWRGMGFLRAVSSIAVTLLLCTLPAHGLETDQYFAWTRPLKDAADAVNLRFEADIRTALEALAPDAECRDVELAISRRLRRFLFHTPELWASNATTIERIPGTPQEEFDFDRRSIYGEHYPIAPSTWMPASPTLEIGGIRLGADKLGHFVSAGWLNYERFRSGLRRGLSEAEAQLRAIETGLMLERTTLGWLSSGIFSPADAEANAAGMRFYRSLCQSAEPLAARTEQGWKLVRRFDMRSYVTPEWDESYAPNCYRKSLWKKLKPRLRAHCGERNHPLVESRRVRYHALDQVTISERVIQQLVEQGRLPDPKQFSIDAVCGDSPTALPKSATSEGPTTPPADSETPGPQNRPN